MTLRTFVAVLLGVALGCSVAGCASSALAPLLKRVDSIPMHQWNYESPTTSELGDLAMRLRWAASYLGIKIIVNPEMADYELGSYHSAERQIWINGGLKLDGQVYTVAHELGHALQPPALTEAQREIFAEAVAFLVIYPVKDDTERFARYMARYKTQARQVVQAYDREIWWAVRFLRMEGRTSAR